MGKILTTDELMRVPIRCPLCGRTSMLSYRPPDGNAAELNSFEWKCPNDSCPGRATLRLHGEVTGVTGGFDLD
jgi:hypothetical protein